MIHNNLNWTIGPGEYWALVGRSGSGKTTLGRIMIGLDKPNSGDILWNEVKCSNLREVWAMQSQKSSLFNMPASENISFTLKYSNVLYTDQFLDEVACHYCAYVGLDPALLEHYPHQLSGGQQKLVALARALVQNHPMLLLDEPTAGLDPVTALQYEEVVSRITNELGIAVVMITHDPIRIQKSKHVALLQDGQITVTSGDQYCLEWWKRSKKEG